MSITVKYPQYKLDLVKEKEYFPYSLLLLADETVNAINKYVYDSDVYVLKEQEKELAVFWINPKSCV
ncbi:hypothetical protein HX052_11295 [Myroides marinus]|uniref:hypothetical protein n=1 Tax=Myroides marinus TaxID=703342 RepID=UPI002575E175|nr:hypothetical protein [Myroides marinus]MDM1390545.1 hypothetical protein [Myroides marinus]